MLKKLKYSVLVLLTALVLLTLGGYFFPDRLQLEGVWKLPIKRQVAFQMMTRADILSQILQFFPDTNSYHVISYSEPFAGGGIAWYRRSDGNLTAYIEYKHIQPDSLVFLELNFRHEGKASLLLWLKPEGQSSQIHWKYEARFGPNPVARYFGLSLRKMVKNKMDEFGARAVNSAQAFLTGKSKPLSPVP
ncbi:MAG: hypothetical protein NZM65_08690 [Flavobacteriales bacterium]|nr:hypothetical protein [Flavobacteriales bacterium]MDW8410749.1 hypothetical protein [Flavobacteriales bacterium]